MAIIRYQADLLTTSFYYNEYPNHMVSESEKETDKYQKKTMDYFSTIAFQQYNENQKFDKNYQLLKGIIDKSDFYEAEAKSFDTETQTFVDELIREEGLPQYVKHYPMMNPPINALIGELSARPDNIRIKAFDDDSKNEELIEKSNFLQRYIVAQIQQRISNDLLQQGYQMNTEEFDEQLAALSEKDIQQYMTSYTSQAEKWANHVLSALKISLNLKEKSEDAFRDLLITSREFFLIYQDKSRLGLGVKVLNPKNVWYLTTPDKKYLKDAYATGTIEVMELSEILDEFPLSKEEIEYLNDQAKGFYLEGMGVRQSNLLNNKDGQDSVTYDVYDPLVAKYKLFAESKLLAEAQLNTFLGLSQSGYITYGSKFIVVRSFWRSKKKVGLLTYYNPDNPLEILTKWVDESYKKIPEQIDIKWTWVDQWYQGVKIGPHVYIDFKPLKYLDYSPLLGVIHESKNTEARSLVDLMKPFQVLYNICLNQMYQLLKKDLGVVMLTNMRYIPKSKDGDYQDSLDEWEMNAKERGILFVDDSPENMKGAGSFAQTSRQDLSRANEMQARYNLAAQLKLECWELAGFSRERLGSVAATQTATGTQAALARSFTQTEPYFVAHEYVLQQVFQAMVDTAQFVESKKPTSTISYITNEGENAFIQVNGSEIKLRDFHIYASSSQEDQRTMNELRQLAQSMLQNGASPYDIAMMYGTNSQRQIKDVLRKAKEDQEALVQRQMGMEQQQIEQQQAQFEQQMQYQELVRRETMANENYQKELDRINKKEIAIIQTFSRQDDNTKDANGDGVPDLVQISELSLDTQLANQSYNEAISKISLEREKLSQARDMELEKIKLEKEKIKVEREKIKASIRVAQYGDKGTKNSPKK